MNFVYPLWSVWIKFCHAYIFISNCLAASTIIFAQSVIMHTYVAVTLLKMKGEHFDYTC